ncbi:hypothetical protein EON63_11830, partial [archaeon]
MSALRGAIEEAKSVTNKPTIIKVSAHILSSTYHHTPFTYPIIHHTPYTIYHTPYTIHHTPYIIQVRTIIGFGSSKANTHGVHGAPLGAKDLKEVKAKFGFNPDAVCVCVCLYLDFELCIYLCTVCNMYVLITSLTPCMPYKYRHSKSRPMSNPTTAPRSSPQK